MFYRKYVNYTILFLILSLIIYALSIFIIDPLQQYRKSSWYKPCYTNQRYMNPGLVKTYQFDSIILGTSVTENFSPKMIRKYFNYKSMKLSMEGSSAREQSIMLNTALSTGKVKNVIWGLDMPAFEGEVNRLRNGPNSLPTYLYDTNLLNDYKYLLNIDIFKKYIIKIFLGNVLNKTQYTQPLENFQYWGDKFENQQNILYKKAVNKVVEVDKSILNYNYYDKLIKSFNKNFLKDVKENSSVQFIVFFPPYSYLFWSEMIENKKFFELLKFKKYIIEQTSNLNNVKIYDFQDIVNIIFDFKNYKDHTHYSPDINDVILDKIKEGQYLLDSHNYKHRINNFIELIQNRELYLKKFNE